MVPECSFVYENGHPCGRIPRRGQTLCPAHRDQPARSPAAGRRDRAFHSELVAWGLQLESMTAPQLLAALHRELQTIEPVVSRRFARLYRLAFARAAVTLDASLFALRKAAAASPRQPVARPLSPPYPNPGTTLEEESARYDSPQDSAAAPEAPPSMEQIAALIAKLTSIGKQSA